MTQKQAAAPVAEDLFAHDGDGVSLIGSRCGGCGTCYFPKSLTCRNPACDASSVLPALLGRRGRVYSWTTQVYQPPVPFRMEPWEPHLIALVDLPEGLRVLSMLTDCTPGDVTIDMPVELTTRVMYHDESGRAVAAYAYRPAAGGTGEERS